MAMNKREQAELDTARQALASALALGWPCVLRPKSVDRETIRSATDGNDLYIGWSCHVYLGGSIGRTWTVIQGCSNGINHCWDATDRTTTQGCGQFYATQLDALLEARWRVCEQTAKTLAEIDLAIAICPMAPQEPV